jgi:transcriptional regulator with XRE-family HTH domain
VDATTIEVGRCLIPDLCHAKGITQTQLGDLVGMSRSQISDYCTKRFFPSLENAKLIADALGCHIDDLYEWINVY